MATDNNDGLDFPQFNDLPKEIQLMIWELAVSELRMVWVMPRKTQKTVQVAEDEMEGWIEEWQEHDRQRIPGAIQRNGRSDDEILEDLAEMETWFMMRDPMNEAMQKRNVLNFWSPSPVPSILLACRESFKVASKIYRRAFAHIDGPLLCQTYFDFSRDTLLLCDGFARTDYDSQILEFIEAIDIRSRRRVESLILSADEWDEWDDDTYIFVLASFPALRNLTVIVNHFLHTSIRASSEYDTDLILYHPVDLKHLQSMWMDDFLLHRDDDVYIGSIKRQTGVSQVSENHDLDYIRDCQLGNRHLGLDDSWKLPNIEYRILVSREEKAFLDWVHDQHLRTVERSMQTYGMMLEDY